MEFEINEYGNDTLLCLSEDDEPCYNYESCLNCPYYNYEREE